MTYHVHRFYRYMFGRRPVTKWRCSCGIKTKNTDVVKVLEGRS